MKSTKIQWCHSTVNPVMGCDGCELWPGPGVIARELAETSRGLTELPPSKQRAMLHSVIGDRPLSELYANRNAVASALLPDAGSKECATVVDLQPPQHSIPGRTVVLGEDQ
ncbi:MAG TPA: hypothetical protein VG167_20075 [Verrucomicrobiae bacterium]|nr:hypothetical protein [Verrucomicrobiae bacterium]